ncbi:hypothetical protein [Streptomyces sp. NPDC005438]|uniref:hypothetical protein n=1 Tax=Streptomyces sp. NPDC005438 TaxID=3156880 RepID=UPI0033BBB9F2
MSPRSLGGLRALAALAGICLSAAIGVLLTLGPEVALVPAVLGVIFALVTVVWWRRERPRRRRFPRNPGSPR